MGAHLLEFQQEAGEIVYVPDNWGHAILNLQPCAGVSKQMGTFTWKDGPPEQVTDLM